MSMWHQKHGSWWALQFCWDRWLSLGVHVDLRCRRTGREGLRYGPYIDIHLGPAIASVGVNPVYAGSLDLMLPYSRGGKNAEDA